MLLPTLVLQPVPCLQYLDYGFTSGMEEQLDVVAGGWVAGCLGGRRFCLQAVGVVEAKAGRGRGPALLRA